MSVFSSDRGHLERVRAKKLSKWASSHTLLVVAAAQRIPAAASTNSLADIGNTIIHPVAVIPALKQAVDWAAEQS